MSTESRTFGEIVNDAVDKLMTAPNSTSTIRELLVGLMDNALYLEMKAEWDEEDKHGFTEGLTFAMAEHLPSLSADEARSAAAQLGLRGDDLAERFRATENEWS